MIMNTDTIIMWTAVIGLLITIFAGIVKIVQAMFTQAQHLLVAPLISQLATLSEKITTFGKIIDDYRVEQAATRERLAKVEQSADTLHERVDKIDEQFHNHLCNEMSNHVQ